MTPDAPPVPGVARLAWLLFMQPIQLHRLFRAWGLDPNVSGWRMLRLARDGHLHVALLLVRFGVLLVVGTPFVAFTVSGLVTTTGHSVDGTRVAFGVAMAVAGGVAVGVAGDVAGGVTRGVALGMAVGVAWGVAVSVAVGVAGGVALGVPGGVAVGVALGVALGVAGGVASGMALGIALGVAGGGGALITQLRLPMWPLEVVLMRLVSVLSATRRDEVAELARWLPHRHHDLIHLPLPGLHAFLIEAGRHDPELGVALIAEAAETVGQKRIAQQAQVELLAQALEAPLDAAQIHRVAEWQISFLPARDAVAPDSPLLAFQRAATDLRSAAQTRSHPHRDRALDGAKQALVAWRNTVALRPGRGIFARASADDLLAERLLGVARLWLDHIEAERTRLENEMRERPQVPLVFVAGPILKPEDGSVYKGRVDLVRLIDHDLTEGRRGVVLVHGQRRMGKSSLLYHLPVQLGTGTVVRIANFQELSGSLHRETPHVEVLAQVALEASGLRPPPAERAWGPALAWLREADARISGRVLVAIDEGERVQSGIQDGWCSTDFLDFARAVGDSLRRIRLLLVSAYPLARLGPHWLDRLVSVTEREVGYLDESTARELLTRPVPDFPDIYPPGGVERILRATHGHPYLVQKVGDLLARQLNDDQRLSATDADVTRALDAASGDQLFDELWRQRTDEERALLAGLARGGDGGSDNTTLRTLVRERFVERRDDRVEIAVPLFRDWIASNA